MARRVHVEEHENHERWLVSYADFITLLFSFFVVMYAISTLSESKYKVLSDSLVQAFRHDRVVTAQSTGLAPINRTTQSPTPRNPRPPDALRYHQEQKLLGIAAKITDALRALMQAGQVKLTQLPHGLAVEINASVLFAPDNSQFDGYNGVLIGRLSVCPSMWMTLSMPASVCATFVRLPMTSGWIVACAGANSTLALISTASPCGSCVSLTCPACISARSASVICAAMPSNFCSWWKRSVS